MTDKRSVLLSSPRGDRDSERGSRCGIGAWSGREWGEGGREGGRKGEAGNDVKSNRPFSLGGRETLIRMKMWFNEDENGNCAGQRSPHEKVLLSQEFPSGCLRGWDKGMGEEDLGMRRDVVRASVFLQRFLPHG